MSETLTVVPGEVTLATLRRVARDGASIAFPPETWAAVEASAGMLATAIAEDRTVYGVNTGFGKLASTRIGAADLATLQRNLLLSHATGTGPELSDEVIRLVLATKAIGLARGYSGVRPETIRMLLALLSHGVCPCVPAKGSVGASGDLTPLAHLSSILIGVGEATHKGRRMPAADALAIAGLAPIVLGPKEGLALINGTQVSTALALSGLFAAEDAFAAAMVAGAMTVDGAKGSSSPFDARIHAARGHAGQADAAAAYRRLLAGSGIMAAHGNKNRVQDPYSLRCQPQVMGAILDTLRFAARTLGIEANAVSDNPIVFAAEGDVLSGGNFHAEPVAFGADFLAIALSEIGAMSERRTAFLVDTSLSGLPAFLVRSSGLNSGFMVAQITAAALASENKALAHPSSVDSIPTAANQEDHVSMATYGARRLAEIADNVRGIVAIELIAAAQALDFQAPLETSADLAAAHAAVRAKVAHYDEDRRFAEDIAAIKAEIAAGTFNRFAPLGPSLG